MNWSSHKRKYFLLYLKLLLLKNLKNNILTLWTEKQVGLLDYSSFRFFALKSKHFRPLFSSCVGQNRQDDNSPEAQHMCFEVHQVCIDIVQYGTTPIGRVEVGLDPSYLTLNWTENWDDLIRYIVLKVT